MKGFVFLAVAVVANLSTNFSLKAAVRDLDTSSFATIFLGLVSSPWAWLGGVSGLLLLGAFMAAIRTLPLSVAYPVLTALAIIVMAGIEWWFQGVSFNLWKVSGLILMIAGIALVTANV